MAACASGSMRHWQYVPLAACPPVLIGKGARRVSEMLCCKHATLPLMAGMVLLLVLPVRAADSQASRLVGQANQALAEGRTDEALELYDKAAGLVADSPELAYNRGVAYYRKGDRTKAAEQFKKALTTRDLQLEARAKFNLGNCAYAEALDKQQDLKAALEQLRLAISYYKDAIAADPDDIDAKMNIETAQLLMKHLLDQEKNKQQEQQDQQNDDQNESPESQPERPQSQPASQPESREDKQEQQDGQEQDGNPDRQDEERQQGQDQQAGDEDEQNEKDGQEGKVEPQQQESAGGEQGEDDQEGEQAGVREMTPEQAENLLQRIRDRERERREALLRLRRMRQVPVDKDW